MLLKVVVVVLLRREVLQIVELESGRQAREGMVLRMELVVVEVGKISCPCDVKQQSVISMFVDSMSSFIT